MDRLFSCILIIYITLSNSISLILSDLEANASQINCDLNKFNSYLYNEGKDIYLMSSLCESSIVYLKTRLAGDHGPVLQHDLETVMCSENCLHNDLLHLLAMQQSGCNCSQLSSDSYIENDFCRQNSARILCENLGVCGTWNCPIDDFMCPRYDWNHLYPCGAIYRNPDLLLIIISWLFLNSFMW